jgi:secreted PhoX family phosphatase
VAVDAHGDVYIADKYNNVVEEVTPAGTLSVVAGDGKAGRPVPGPATNSRLYYPTDVAVGPRGDLFIADTDNAVVEEVTPAGILSVVAGVPGDQGPPAPGPATSSTLSDPTGVAVDAEGDLFIADTDNAVVDEVTPEGKLSVVAGDPDKAGPTAHGPASSSPLGEPTGVAVGAHGDVFIAETQNSVVDEVTPAGELSIFAGRAGRSGPPTRGPADRSELNSPTGVAFDAHGDMFIADTGNNMVEEVTPAGALSVVAGVGGVGGPPTPGPATKSMLDYPLGVAADARGDVFIADGANNVVERVTRAGVLSVVAGQARKAP